MNDELAVGNRLAVRGPGEAAPDAEDGVGPGVIDRSSLPLASGQFELAVGATDIQDLVDLVMLPGRFGLNVPLELLVRAWGRGDFSSIGYVLREFDILRSHEDASGRVVVGPRHPLEARLIGQARFGSIGAEIEVLAKLVSALRSGPAGSESDDEVAFTIELVRAVGPQGVESRRYRPFYREIARALTELRETRNLRSPRLMLQEANLLREWVTLSSQSKDRPPDAKEVLLQAQATAQEAIEQLGAGGGQRSLRSVLATELATALGAETVDAVNRDASPGEVSESFHRLRRAVQAARSENPHPFYPVDVLVWTTTSVLQKDALGETERLEAIADVFHSLETIDPESLDPSSAERYQKRRLGLGMLLGDEHLTDVAFEELDFDGFVCRILYPCNRTRRVSIPERVGGGRCREVRVRLVVLGAAPWKN